MTDEEQDEPEGDYELGVALVSILVSIILSVGFGVHSITSNGWLSALVAIGFTTGLAVLIRIGGRDGVIPWIGRWVLGSRGRSSGPH